MKKPRKKMQRARPKQSPSVKQRRLGELSAAEVAGAFSEFATTIKKLVEDDPELRKSIWLAGVFAPNPKSWWNWL